MFTQPANIQELYDLANEPIDDYLRYERVPISCRYFFDDKKVVNAYSDLTAFAQELQDKLGEDPAAVRKYLYKSSNLYDNVGRVFLDTSLHKRKMLFKAPITKALMATRPAHLFSTLHQVNKSYFKNPSTVQLFDRFATYNGSNPYQAPGMLSLIPHLELNEGIYYPKGGMISITQALYKLAIKLGVTFHFNAEISRIIKHEQRVRGVVVKGENVHADLVVSNVDVYFTYLHLLKNEAKAQKVLKQERSSSAIIFYWGMKKSFPRLHLHNIFFSTDYQREFKHIFKLKTLSADPTVYVNITSKMEPGHAPGGKENWFVMINAPADVGQDWIQVLAEAREIAITKLSLILGEDIRNLIEVEQTLDPKGIEAETASFMGSLYGTSSNSKFAAFFRHPNYSASIEGLYFAGGSVHPGGGIPLCLKSAAIVSKLVELDIKELLHH